MPNHGRQFHPLHPSATASFPETTRSTRAGSFICHTHLQQLHFQHQHDQLGQAISSATPICNSFISTNSTTNQGRQFHLPHPSAGSSPRQPAFVILHLNMDTPTCPIHTFLHTFVRFGNPYNPFLMNREVLEPLQSLSRESICEALEP